jgi:type 1 glutamine amidotransferase
MVLSSIHRPFEVENLNPAHPVMIQFPASWKTPQGELYEIAKLWPNTTPLARAYGEDSQRYHVCIWVNEIGEGRVFGTTIGHHNETMETEVYLEMITRGLLWACDKLDANGNPKAGYRAK